MNRRLIPIFFIVVASWSFSGSASAVVVTLGAAKDNTLFETTAGELSNGAGQFLFAGRVAQSNNELLRRGLLQFDVFSMIPQGAIIQEASLTLFMSRSIVGNRETSLHRVNADWGEGTSNAPAQEGGGAPSTAGDATWLHTSFATDNWAVNGGDFNQVASASRLVSGFGSYTWNSAGLVGDVQSWLDDPSQNFGWAVLADESGGISAKQFRSRENADVATRPQLTVTYITAVPEPSSLCLLGTIGTAAMCRRRRRG